jgi:hypothetical protein
MNGFQIGSKRLKVQHKRVSSNHLSGSFQDEELQFPSKHVSYIPSAGSFTAAPLDETHFRFDLGPSGILTLLDHSVFNRPFRLSETVEVKN